MGSIPETYNEVIKILIDYVHSILKLFKKSKCICTTILKQRNQSRISLFKDPLF